MTAIQGGPLRAQCMASGLAGDALLHIERARSGTGTWKAAHAALAAVTCHPVVASPAASLYLGAPALAFALHAADGGTGLYARPLTLLSHRTAAIIRQRLRQAHARISAGQRPRTSEYDLFYGLTGLGMLLLAHDPASPELGAILSYLARLATPLPDDHRQLPGWWTEHDPRGSTSAAFPSGHLNLGIAHGIAGPLALMAAAKRRGIAVTGLRDAITRICAILDTWRQNSPAGPWWPQWITLPEHVRGHTSQLGPARPSWCYGTPGIARAQQLAALALGDSSRQHLAQQALRKCLADPAQLSQITDGTLCHGTAGLLITTHHAARDAPPGTYAASLQQIRVLHHRQHIPARTGLLEGSTGTALANLCDTTAGRTNSGWDACILTS